MRRCCGWVSPISRPGAAAARDLARHGRGVGGCLDRFAAPAKPASCSWRAPAKADATGYPTLFRRPFPRAAVAAQSAPMFQLRQPNSCGQWLSGSNLTGRLLFDPPGRGCGRCARARNRSGRRAAATRTGLFCGDARMGTIAIRNPIAQAGAQPAAAGRHRHGGGDQSSGGRDPGRGAGNPWRWGTTCAPSAGAGFKWDHHCANPAAAVGPEKEGGKWGRCFGIGWRGCHNLRQLGYPKAIPVE